MVKIKNILFCFCLCLPMLISCSKNEDPIVGVTPKPVVKTNTTKVLMHFMPWFQSPETSGYWGSHWKMTNKNPDIIDGSGKRQIAAHYYPLTGPYDTKDPIIIEYQMLLMKYSGIDGIMIDWYGSHNVNDYAVNLKGSNAIIDKLPEAGLEFSIVYEDYSAGIVGDKTSLTGVEAAQKDMLYMQDNYFSKSNYTLLDGAPLLTTFGPRTFNNSSQWMQIFDGLTTKPTFLPLWNNASKVGSNGQGEFAWIDFKSDLSELNKFYSKGFKHLIGSAYPGFHDFYAEGGTGTSYGYVDYNEGNTLKNTLAKATDRKAKTLQLVTWNDYGEGTMLEPTLERGFDDLVTIQQWTGVSYGKAELELIFEYYNKRKKYKDDVAISAKIKEAYDLLGALEVKQAREIINSIE